ncbi:MAG: hypothetical protein EOO05_10775 [Chitinophagaceae bacterium]|nr:MAG: hypothetical protein EOO05_10775 [Chitinophagaceae bacterium]
MRRIHLGEDEESEIFSVQFVSPSKGFIATTSYLGVSADSGRTYTELPITTSNTDFGALPPQDYFAIRGVKVFSEQTILVHGHYYNAPAILRSTDGGHHFRLVAYTANFGYQNFITDMDFADNTAGYAIDKFNIYKTVDAGLTWSIKNISNYYATSIDVIDANTVFLTSSDYSNTRILKTVNGGLGWNIVPIPETSAYGSVTSATFFDVNNGWAVFDEQRLYRTTNGGTSWTMLNNPWYPSFVPGKMKFTSASTGYAPDNFHIRKTSDGGQTWERLPRDNNFQYANFAHTNFFFLNETQFWAGGHHDFLELTTNSGGTPIPSANFSIDTTGVSVTAGVKLNNLTRSIYTYQWYVNGNLVSTAFSPTYLHDVRLQQDTIKLIAINGSDKDSITRYHQFEIPVLPVITDFYPRAAMAGTTISITGINLNLVKGVMFGGTPAQSFSIVSPTQITAVVGSGATGDVSVWSIPNVLLPKPGFTFITPVAPTAPAITGISPGFGPAGTAVTINGQRFASGITGNSVFFGTIKATVTAASATQLTVRVPSGIGTDPISILNNSTGKTTRSTLQFVPTFPDSTDLSPISFEKQLQLNYPSTIHDSRVVTAAADFDGDGKPDLLTSLLSPGDTIAIYRNTTASGGAVSFGNRNVLASIPQPYYTSITTPDLNNDGKPDVLFGASDNRVVIFINNSSPGTISFRGLISLAINSPFVDVTSGDIDGDGWEDIVASMRETDRVIIFKNKSVTGEVPEFDQLPYIDAPAPQSATIADLDGDGKKDLLIISYQVSYYARKYINRSQPGQLIFDYAGRFSLGAGLNGPRFGVVDWNLDGRPDLMIPADNVVRFYNNASTPGDIQFNSDVTTRETFGYLNPVAASLSGDRRPDLLTAGGRQSAISNLTVNGSFGSGLNQVWTDMPLWYPTGSSSADFNNDGKPDLAGGLREYDAFVVFVNRNGEDRTIKICQGSGSQHSGFTERSPLYWEENRGAGFARINDSENIQGTTTQVLSFSNIPDSWNGYKYRSVSPQGPSAVFTLDIGNKVLPVINITQLNPLSCYGDTIRFRGDTLHYGPNSTIVWQVNGVRKGLNSLDWQYGDFANGDTVRAITYYTHPCYGFLSDTSNYIIMSVPGGTPKATISTISTFACQNDTLRFVSAFENIPDGATYQWKDGGAIIPGATAPVYTTGPVVRNISLELEVTIAGCSTPRVVKSNTVYIPYRGTDTRVVINSPITVPLCTGVMHTFEAIPYGTEGLPVSYLWLVNGRPTGTDSSEYSVATLQEADTVQVWMALKFDGCQDSSYFLSQSHVVQIKGSPVKPSITVTPDSIINICRGSYVTFNAQITNGGAEPKIIWHWGSGFDYAWGNGLTWEKSFYDNLTVVYAVLWNSDFCAIPNTDTTDFILVSTSGIENQYLDLLASADTICAGESVTYTAQNRYGGFNPTIRWFKNGVPLAHTAWQIELNGLVGGDKIYCEMTSSSDCSVSQTTRSKTATVVVAQALSPRVSIAGNNILEPGASTQLTSTVVNAGGLTGFEWQDSTSNHTWRALFTGDIAAYQFYPVENDHRIRLKIEGVSGCNNQPYVIYSNVLAMELVETGTGRTAVAFPNPVTNAVRVDSLNISDGWIMSEILNLSNPQATLKKSVVGQTSVSFDVSMLPPGQYMIRVTGSRKRPLVIRFTKM